ncbi:23512_t:CDS:2 [Dentiscutata erythropus]|uniref:23512_t:CDS:1 n=1 Tax=Dentiscutata erythropus TaxID=1348616 RepID=A0A9N9EWC7_9GLOM|nr:23512_t:CDS:2 [Dentiscutata erythropus]
MPIRTHSVNINPKKTSSTSKETKLIEVENKKKYWHRDLWAESPLLGQDKITIDGAKFYSSAYLAMQESQLWLVDQYLEEECIIVDTSKIIKKINISIVRTSRVAISLYIKEILYKNNGH